MITNRLYLDHERSSQDLSMKAQRRRYNHLATTWTRSPRWNYSRFIPEASMMKKKASGMISPPAGYRKELQIPPRSRDDGGGGYRQFRGIPIGYLGFRHRGLLIGEEARLGGGQGPHTLPRRGVGPPAPRGVWPPCGAASYLLRTPCCPR